jgi:phage baseplate assembly protein W
MARALAAEDKDLTSSLVIARNRKYKDIDLTFAKKGSGEIYKKEDAAAVKQSIKTLLLTNRFEKPFLPRFGGDLRGQLFELMNGDVSQDIKERIISQIEAFEPRAKILSLNVRANEDQNDLRVNLTVAIKNTTQQINFSFAVSRLR